MPTVKKDGYTNIVLKYNVPEKVTLVYDTPLEKEGKWGKFYIYRVVDENNESATMLVSATQKGEDFKTFKENLDKFKAGDTIEIVKTEQYTKNGAQFALFKVTKVGEKDISSFLPKQTTNDKPVNMTEEEEYIMNKLKEQVKDYSKEKLENYKKQFIEQLVDKGLTEIRANFLFEKVILN